MTLNAEQRAICEALLFLSYSGGFDNAYPLARILEGFQMPAQTVLYDEKQEVGLLWGLACEGYLRIFDGEAGQYARVAFNLRWELERLVREPAELPSSASEVRRSTLDGCERAVIEAAEALAECHALLDVECGQRAAGLLIKKVEQLRKARLGS